MPFGGGDQAAELPRRMPPARSRVRAVFRFLLLITIFVSHLPVSERTPTRTALNGSRFSCRDPTRYSGAMKRSISAKWHALPAITSTCQRSCAPKEPGRRRGHSVTQMTAPTV